MRQFLLEATLRMAGIEFMEATTANGVREPVKPGRVSVNSTAGILTADMMVGADGVYSAAAG